MTKFKIKKILSEENPNVGETVVKAISTSHGSVYSLQKVTKNSHKPKNSFLSGLVDIFKDIINFRLLKDRPDILFITISNFFVAFGFFTPFLYITKIAEENSIPNELATLLISIIGIVNIPARLAYGFLADRRFISPVNLNSVAALIATIPLYFYFKLQVTFSLQVLFSIFFAIGTGNSSFGLKISLEFNFWKPFKAGLTSLSSAYLMDLVGNEKFSNATGIINFSRGLGCFIGPFTSGISQNKFSSQIIRK